MADSAAASSLISTSYECAGMLRHGTAVGCVCVVDGWVVTATWDSKLHVFDMSDGRRLRTIALSRVLRCIGALSDGHVAVGHGSTLEQWDVVEGRCVQALTGHRASSSIDCLDTLRHGRVVTGGGLGDGKIKYWELAESRCLQTFTASETFTDSEGDDEISGVNCVAFAPPDRILSGSNNGLKIWDLATGSCLQTLDAQGRYNPNWGLFRSVVESLAVLSDGRVVAGSGCDSLNLFKRCPPGAVLDVWDITEYRLLKTLTDETERPSAIHCLAALPDGRILSGGGILKSDKHTLKIWDLNGGHCVQRLSEGHQDEVYCAAVLPDGRVISGSRDRTARVWFDRRRAIEKKLAQQLGSQRACSDVVKVISKFL